MLVVPTPCFRRAVRLIYDGKFCRLKAVLAARLYLLHYGALQQTAKKARSALCLFQNFRRDDGALRPVFRQGGAMLRGLAGEAGT